MHIICILMISAGTLVLGYSCVKYYGFLRDLKVQLHSKRIFESRVYFLCFVLILLFMCGYTAESVYVALSGSAGPQDLLIAFILLGGAIFVRAIVALVIRFGDTEQLKYRLEQQELMSKISLSFMSRRNPTVLINEALELSAVFMRADHAFLSKYDSENRVMECKYEYCGSKARPFIGSREKWPFSPGIELVDDLHNQGYIAVEDFRQYKDAQFNVVADYDLRAFLNIPIEVSGEFWGLLGFILYEETYSWNISNVQFGQLLAGIFSGTISKNIAEESLVNAKELAEQGSRSKSDFLSRMSHEMRTPMNAIIGMTSIGLGASSVERKDDCFTKIESASNQLLETINNVLDMSKIEANKLEFSVTDFDLSSMIGTVETIVGQGMKSKQQHYKLHLAEDVPAYVRTDEQRLIQVLINLMGNATKFTPEQGTISLFVRNLGTIGSTCTLEFEVRDTGIGISDEQQANLFNPFEQADGSISRKYGGTGLGLSISKQIIEMLGGSIRLESTPLEGSSFIFSVRVGVIGRKRNVHGEEVAETAVRRSAPEASHDFSKLRVLIAEDIEINREIVASLLEHTGLTIDFAFNGRHAYEIFTAQPSAYSMIFMDIHMPEVDGFEATKMIRKLDIPEARTVPIVAMTADVFREDIEKCLEAGMNAHVGKPLKRDALTAHIAAFCA